MHVGFSGYFLRTGTRKFLELGECKEMHLNKTKTGCVVFVCDSHVAFMVQPKLCVIMSLSMALW